MKKYICTTCGYDQLEEPPRENGGPSFEICECCGVEFGYQDCTPESNNNFRCLWKKSDYQWHVPERKPKNWDINKQLKNIGLSPDNFCTE